MMSLQGPPDRWREELVRADLQNVKRGGEFDAETGVVVYRYSNGDVLYLVDTTSANRTVTLPDVFKEVGRRHIIKRISGGANTLTVTGDANFDGAASVSIATQYAARTFVSDGDEWHLVGIV